MITVDRLTDAEKHLDGIKAVIFDLDDTLYNERDYVWSGYNKIAAMFPEIPALSDELWAAFTEKKPAIDVVFEKHGILDKKSEALAVYRNQMPDIHLNDETRELLDRLSANYNIGIITDGRPEGQRAKLKALGLDTIPFIITDELGGTEFRKPCPLAFEKMAAEFCVSYNECAYIGDNISKDFIAPEKLGWKTIHYCNYDGLYFSKF